MAASTNAFEMAQRQFDHVAELLNSTPGGRNSALANARISFPHPGAHG
jgi:hypothetical protein